MPIRSIDHSTFPFLELPIEIRDMIYDHLLVNKHFPSLNYSRLNHYHKLNISTSILYISHQVHAESSRVLYGRNAAVIGVFPKLTIDGRLLRADHGTVKMTTLRSGRALTTSSSVGRLYPYVLLRFNELRIRHSWFQQHPLGNGLTAAGALRNSVEEILGSAICTVCQPCSPTTRKMLTLEVGDK